MVHIDSKPLEPKAKFAMIFGLCVVILAAILRVIIWYFPQPTDAELAAAREKKSAEVEAVLSKGLEKLTQAQQGEADTAAYSVVTPDVIANTDKVNGVTVEHQYEAKLGTGLYPQIVQYNDTYILGYVTGTTFMVQRLSLDYKPLGDAQVLVESLPMHANEILVPKLQLMGEQLAVLRYQSIVQENAVQPGEEQFEQVVELRNIESLAVETTFIGLRSNVSATDVTYHIELSWLTNLANHVAIVTAINDADVSVSTYTMAGAPVQENFLQDVGTMVSALGGAKAVMLVSQQADQLRFTRIPADPALSVYRYALAADANTPIADFALHGEYVMALDSANTLQILSQDVQSQYPDQVLSQILTDPHIVRTSDDGKLLVVHNPVETRFEGASEINTHNIVVEEYRVVTTPALPVTTQ